MKILSSFTHDFKHVLAVNATDYDTYCNNPNVEFEIWQLRKEGNYDLNMGLFVTQTRLL